jgi:hypothetical protein
MNDELIDGIMDAVVDAGVRVNADQLLDVLRRHFSNKLVITWTTEDVTDAIDDDDLKLDEQQAIAVLEGVAEVYSHSDGVTYNTVEDVAFELFG